MNFYIKKKLNFNLANNNCDVSSPEVRNDKSDEKTEIIIYPNPTSGMINLDPITRTKYY